MCLLNTDRDGGSGRIVLGVVNHNTDLKSVVFMKLKKNHAYDFFFLQK